VASAISQLVLARAISQPSQWGLTPAILQFDSEWDPLRGDPRFEQLVASLASKEPTK